MGVPTEGTKVLSELLVEDPLALKRRLVQAMVDTGGDANTAARNLDTSKFHFYRLLKKVGLDGARTTVERYCKGRYRAPAA